VRNPFEGNALEFAKWIAVILMTINHTTDALKEPWLDIGYWAGRPCLPLFAAILVLRFGDSQPEKLVRALRRLTLWGAISEPIYIALSVAIALRLDVLFSLAAGVLLLWLLGRRRYVWLAIACVVLAFGNRFLDGGALTPLAMLLGEFARRRSPWAAIWAIALAGIALNWVAEPQLWPAAFAALLAPPIFALSLMLRRFIPRLPMQVFYAYYPLHLAVIYLALGPYP
jgi:hypothetical protein